jgi:hypothetical protein
MLRALQKSGQVVSHVYAQSLFRLVGSLIATRLTWLEMFLKGGSGGDQTSALDFPPRSIVEHCWCIYLACDMSLFLWIHSLC